MTMRQISVLPSLPAVIIFLTIALAATASFKLHTLLTDPYAGLRQGGTALEVWIAFAVECMAVSFVVFGRSAEAKRFILFVLYAVFASESTFNVFAGRSVCPCAGSIQLHPAWFLAFALFGMLLLLIARPSFFSTTDVAGQELQRRFALSVFSVVFAIGLVSISKFTLHPNKSPLIALPGHVAMGEVQQEVLVATTSIRNISNSKICIVDTIKGCTCVSALVNDDLLLPGESAQLTSTIDTRGRPGDFRSTVMVLYAVTTGEGERLNVISNRFTIPVVIEAVVADGVLKQKTPVVIKMQDIRADKKIVQATDVLNPSGSKIEIVELIESPPGISCDIQPDSTIVITLDCIAFKSSGFDPSRDLELVFRAKDCLISVPLVFR